MKKTLIALMVLVALVSSVQAASVSTLSVTTVGANWYLYCTVDNQSNGLASFTIDLMGTGGTQIVTSDVKAPNYVNSSTFAPVGFQSFPSGGVITAGSAIGISAGQATAYGDVNVPANDAKVIQGIGQTANTTPIGFQGATWGVPVLLAQGTFTGPGTFNGLNMAGNLLSKVNAGAWLGSGNVEPGDFRFVPEPCTMTLLVVGGIGALLRRRAA